MLFSDDSIYRKLSFLIAMYRNRIVEKKSNFSIYHNIFYM